MVTGTLMEQSDLDRNNGLLLKHSKIHDPLGHRTGVNGNISLITH